MTTSFDEFNALGLCLSPEPSLQELTALRLRFLSKTDSLARLTEFAASRDLLPALEFGLSRHRLIPPSGPVRPDTITCAAYFNQIQEDHLKRRAAMTEHLVTIVRALNERGIVPLLLKGCVSLWSDQNRWRHMRDMDLMVHPAEVQIALEALRRLGFRDSPALEGGKADHHLPPLVRVGMPGWLELHEQISNRRVERYLRTDDLASASVESARHGGHARILQAPHMALHGFAHHHFGHRSSSFGTLNLKGLHEFAWAIATMTADERNELEALARHSRRLRVAFEFWAAAAAEFYRVRLPPNWRLGAKATEEAQSALRRSATGVHESLFSTFMREAFQSSEEASAGEEIASIWSARLLERFAAVKDAGRDIVVPWRNRDHLRKTSAGIRE